MRGLIKDKNPLNLKLILSEGPCLIETDNFCAWALYSLLGIRTYNSQIIQPDEKNTFEKAFLDLQESRNTADHELSETQPNNCGIIDICEHVIEENAKEQNMHNDDLANKRQHRVEKLRSGITAVQDLANDFTLTCTESCVHSYCHSAFLTSHQSWSFVEPVLRLKRTAHFLKREFTHRDVLPSETDFTDKSTPYQHNRITGHLTLHQEYISWNEFAFG